ncbi:hypothetical protein DWX81_07400 [Roseburia inulinivorans]|uniref:hypothetical protein n=1 Tax=Roseburia inulinivorans TaxID=360807 RepID=UPI000E50FA1B|nr:hypothetical protein [Roseburia inulinivorans]RGS67274.1 hypothetical protein DWX81_07400 [Roseburia inulinivorans]
MSRVLPILFNTEMVRAILDGRKTCTRRLVKPQPDEKHTYPLGFVTDSTEKKEVGCFGFGIDEYGGSIKYVKTPYQPGDILYVRETWQYLYKLDGNEQIIEDTGKYYYAATDTISFNTYVDENGLEHEHVPWKPSIHMPKEAARIWLKVTDVRVERLQEITSEQICREGVEVEYPHVLNGEEKRYAFSTLWNSTIKKSDIDRYGWDANPYVWVISFERCEKPEGV